jgi:hypothetical protein
MKRSMISWCLLACWGGASCALAVTPFPIDRPTPPPCAADGTCYPNEGTWGWYQCRWRKWPGEELVPTPEGVQRTPAELQKGTDLTPYETPTPEHEDTQAPPSTTKKNETSSAATPEGEPGAPSEGAATSHPVPSAETPTPPRPPQATPAPSRGYSTPSYPTPNYPAPYKPSPTSPSGARQPTGDADPPPALPWPKSSLSRRPAVADALPNSGPRASRSVAPRSSGDDPPPSMPSLFHSAAL